MSSSTKANFARKMALGSYHQNIFRGERGTFETPIATASERGSSNGTPTKPLTFSIGDIALGTLNKLVIR